MGLRYLTPLNDVRNLMGEADSSLFISFQTNLYQIASDVLQGG
uniref:Uncharacterized protein n=1 Tax=Siphoviridae sp. ct8M020 TaxID=2825362 RepID=A0A8S5PLQ9_9CAUD|nr:MAG TPA: hypothetical protein [Siphoviridae sp. ct8M020]